MHNNHDKRVYSSDYNCTSKICKRCIPITHPHIKAPKNTLCDKTYKTWLCLTMFSLLCRILASGSAEQHTSIASLLIVNVHPDLIRKSIKNKFVFQNYFGTQKCLEMFMITVKPLSSHGMFWQCFWCFWFLKKS